jgi:hypothetical protein
MASGSFRSILHSAFVEVRSGAVNNATATLTIDHLLLEQISFLKQGETRQLVDGTGDSAGSRISRYDRLDAMLTQLESAVDAVAAAKTDEKKLAALGLSDEVSL